MGINIVAERKMSLEGFAEGWGKCFLRLRAVNEEKRMAWGKLLNEDLADEVAIPKLRDAVREVLIGGKVITTDDGGNTRDVSITEGDYDDVVAVLNIYWLQEAILVSTGADRLKG